ncbi:hypothetical protein BpHYR1_006761 [Brachionus plicatilis]|uniref:Uncharacterized protein n=1 Tax=Brachionus plicatilis TaxID=10195 RepID=A0A3M7SHE9_BRAPC|nr:hypothetical protein BpHYR1_006761 [Brachionus plicatilis]
MNKFDILKLRVNKIRSNRGLSSNTHLPTFLLAKRTTSHHSDSSCFGLLAGIFFTSLSNSIQKYKQNTIGSDLFDPKLQDGITLFII